MRLSWSVPVLIVLGALAGYAAGARPVQAQSQTLPFVIGEIVTFSFQGGGTHKCRVEEMRGTFARCGVATESLVGGVGVRQPPDQWWVNLAVVEWVAKPREQR